MSFSLDMSAFAKKAGKNADAVVRKTFFDLTIAITQDTPRLTGRAQGAWMTSIDSPDDTAPINVRSVEQVKEDITAGILQWKAGQTLWFSNNMVYIVPLEYGYSNKAPQGMARLNIMRFQTFVNKAVSTIK